MKKFAQLLPLLGLAATIGAFTIRLSGAGTTTAEPALEPAKINSKPGEEYADKSRDFNMVLGGDITPRGRIWVAWISGGDSYLGYLLGATSDDGGKTWSKPTLAIDPHFHEPERQGLPGRRALVGNFWSDPLGRMWLFYDQSLGYFDGRSGVWATVSSNPDAKRPDWSNPRRLFNGALLNKPIVTSNGEWLAFSSLWVRSAIDSDLFREGHHDLDANRGINVYRSTDQGQTWQQIGLVSVKLENWSFDEPSAVELKNGDLWMLIRTTLGLKETFSEDGGVTWSKPVQSAIASASARVFLRRLASGNLLLVKYGKEIDANRGRTELTAYLSKDEGRRWLGGLVLDDRNPATYPDGFQAPDGSIHIFYDHDRGGAAEILSSTFSEKEVLEGKFDAGNDRKRVLVNKATKPKPPKPAGPAANPKKP